MKNGKPGEPVNICNGVAVKISTILDMLVEISGTHARVVSDKALFRPADEPLLLGDDTKIKALGYVREFSMQQTLEDVFADWMSRV